MLIECMLVFVSGQASLDEMISQERQWLPDVFLRIMGWEVLKPY